MSAISPVSHDLLVAIPLLLALTLYILAAWASNNRLKPWPIVRTVYWTLGILTASAAVTGPLFHNAHDDFEAHMVVHLLLGMLAPFLMVMAAPLTLVLRTLPVRPARQITKLLKSPFFGMLTNPVAASALHVGGLWLVYATRLYPLMHHDALASLLVHAHIFLAGYLFTASMISVEPVRYQASYMYRAAVFIMASACHGILSKHIYAHPPDGVSLAQSETAGYMMYYGGDAIEIMLILVLCTQWFRAARPKTGNLRFMPSPREK
ncbi:MULTISPECIES: cytochrome c oxidase assembly protein [unclassified Paenibacillus]|uniref:cytochrome c oxidase assembly protein n=1 Tax=unclassified Paenibacillus TaxID=185978 RepID=UPI00104DB618|nr:MULTISPECIES: cytochrome c oxidase assembly protein [unclassified Paenibacillus]NIK70813.1 putative membrane protein [Paenibacillus sp. BK720]TCM93216.1 putative membrane protein [Paenibacillus sp. BK033]